MENEEIIENGKVEGSDLSTTATADRLLYRGAIDELSQQKTGTETKDRKGKKIKDLNKVVEEDKKTGDLNESCPQKIETEDGVEDEDKVRIIIEDLDNKIKRAKEIGGEREKTLISYIETVIKQGIKYIKEEGDKTKPNYILLELSREATLRDLKNLKSLWEFIKNEKRIEDQKRIEALKDLFSIIDSLIEIYKKKVKELEAEAREEKRVILSTIKETQYEDLCYAAGQNECSIPDLVEKAVDFYLVEIKKGEERTANAMESRKGNSQKTRPTDQGRVGPEVTKREGAIQKFPPKEVLSDKEAIDKRVEDLKNLKREAEKDPGKLVQYRELFQKTNKDFPDKISYIVDKVYR